MLKSRLHARGGMKRLSLNTEDNETGSRRTRAVTLTRLLSLAKSLRKEKLYFLLAQKEEDFVEKGKKLEWESWPMRQEEEAESGSGREEGQEREEKKKSTTLSLGGGASIHLLWKGDRGDNVKEFPRWAIHTKETTLLLPGSGLKKRITGRGKASGHTA